MTDSTFIKPDYQTEDETKAGNYFVSNYPPFSFWNDDDVPCAAMHARGQLLAHDVAGGLGHDVDAGHGDGQMSPPVLLEALNKEPEGPGGHPQQQDATGPAATGPARSTATSKRKRSEWGTSSLALFATRRGSNNSIQRTVNERGERINYTGWVADKMRRVPHRGGPVPSATAPSARGPGARGRSR